MLSPFHLSKVRSDGSLQWLEGAISVERATARVKVLSASSPGAYVITNLTGKVEFPPKRTMFQIGYEEKELNARAELFRRCGLEVISDADNESAKRALASIRNVDVFVVRQTSGPACRLQYRAEQWERVPVPPSGHGELIPHLSCSRSSCQQMLNLTQKVTVTNQAGSSRFGI